MVKKNFIQVKFVNIFFQKFNPEKAGLLLSFNGNASNCGESDTMSTREKSCLILQIFSKIAKQNRFVVPDGSRIRLLKLINFQLIYVSLITTVYQVSVNLTQLHFTLQTMIHYQGKASFY